MQGYDYNQNGEYFITICTQNKKCLLGRIVGGGVLDAPKIELSKYGKIVDEQITFMGCIYDNIIVEKYVIMPNHIHLLIRIENKSDSGSSRTVRVSSGHLCIMQKHRPNRQVRPTPTNSVVSMFVSTLKRFTNKNVGKKLWQRSYYDHIVRNESEYLKIWEYINSNAQKWQSDKYYVGD